ncbi:hypothetical protein GF352_02930 [archaeon]|nr:hypothetical protein [archaeon]
MIDFLLPFTGLLTGYYTTQHSIDECRGKEKVLLYLLVTFFILLLINFNHLVNVLLLFIIAHLISSIAYLWRNES